MSGFFAGLFGKKGPQAGQPTAAAGVKVQTSCFGKAIPIIYGTTRIAPELILYGDFQAIQTSQSQGGGKGGGSGGSSNTSQNYVYTADLAFALCEGPISGVGTVWKNKLILSLSQDQWSLFTGTYPQTAWSNAVSWTVQTVDNNDNPINVTVDAAQLGYNGIAYVAADGYFLGDSPTLASLNFEIQGVYSASVTGKKDADPSLVLVDFLTNVHYGVGWPSAFIGDLTTWQQYSLAVGFLISPAITESRTAQDYITEWAAATNSAPVWSSGLLTMVPYGDQNVTGNGKTYTAPTQPIYALTDDDFIVGDNEDGAVVMNRKRPSDRINSIKIEYLDRANNYNPAVAYANDQALIDAYGLRTNGSSQLHLFCDQTAAQMAANLLLRREHVSNTYTFTLDQRYILLDPMDIVSITESNLGLNAQWVRITEIDENDDGTLTFTAEEFLYGTGAAPRYGASAAKPFTQNQNADPGGVNNPIVFEPPDELATGDLVLWGGVSGKTAMWGGADVYTSTDGLNYTLIGRVTPARMGFLTATFGLFASADSPDTTHTISVDLTESRATLDSVPTSEADALSTLCFVDGELISYATATLTATYNYDLTYLWRGCYGSDISQHTRRKPFLRLDPSAVFKYSFNANHVHRLVYFKFASFNIYGGGQQTLDQVPAYSYRIGARSYIAQPATVQRLRQNQFGRIGQLRWDQDLLGDEASKDVIYEIRKGDSWQTGRVVQRNAHPPIDIQGPGVYWVAQRTNPKFGFLATYGDPIEITVTDASVPDNILATVNSFSSGSSFSGVVQTAVNGAETDNQLYSGASTSSSGTLTIASSAIISLTYPTACQVVAGWQSQALAINTNIISAVTQSANFSTTAGAIQDVWKSSQSGTLVTTSIVPAFAQINNLNPGTSVLSIGDWCVSQSSVGAGASRYVIAAQINSILSSNSVSIAGFIVSTGISGSSASTNFFFSPNVPIGALAHSSKLTQVCTIANADTPLNSFGTTRVGITLFMSSSGASGSSFISSGGAGSLTLDMNVLNAQDIFGINAPQNCDVFLEMQFSTNAGVSYSSWQRYSPGSYTADHFNFRYQLVTNSRTDYLSVLSSQFITVDVPDRVDHYTNLSISSLGTTLFFRPDGGTTAAFNGGPQGATLSAPTFAAVPHPSTTVAAGDMVIASTIGLSKVVIKYFNSALTAIAGSADVTATGY